MLTGTGTRSDAEEEAVEVAPEGWLAAEAGLLMTCFNLALASRSFTLTCATIQSSIHDALTRERKHVTPTLVQKRSVIV